MNARRKALLEAALMCSQYADNFNAAGFDYLAAVAQNCAEMIEEQADSKQHFYPPQKRVIDLDQVFEN